MASKKIALIITLVILSAFLTGGVLYFSHSSRLKDFDILPAQNITVSGVSKNFTMPSGIMMENKGLDLVGAVQVHMETHNMETNGYLLVLYNNAGNVLDIVSIIGQRAFGNYSIPDKNPSQTIDGKYSLPAYYDSLSTYYTKNREINGFFPDNYMVVQQSGNTTLNILNSPVTSNYDNSNIGEEGISMAYPAYPSEFVPLALTMHKGSWFFYDTSIANIQRNDTFYFVSGVSIGTNSGANTFNWGFSTVFLTGHDFYSEHYLVYQWNLTMTVNLK